LRGYNTDEICEELSILKNTFQRALSENRLTLPPLPEHTVCRPVSTKSSRNVSDNTTGTQMPKRFVSRLRLCMSGSTDYWVNDRLGEPFFVVHKTINEGKKKRTNSKKK
jgi:hypothetical protein